MASYYALMHAESRSELRDVADSDLGGFNSLLLMWDQPVRALPRDVRLYVSSGGTADLLPNPLGWTIVSNRFYQLMKPLLGGSPHETLNPRLESDDTGEPIRGYKLLHPLLTINALANKTRGFVSLHNMIIDVGSIPSGVHLFHLGGYSTVVCISKALMEALKGKGLQGVGVLELTDGVRSQKKKK